MATPLTLACACQNPATARQRARQIAALRKAAAVVDRATLRGWATARERRRFGYLCRRYDRLGREIEEAYAAWQQGCS